MAFASLGPPPKKHIKDHIVQKGHGRFHTLF